MHFVKERKLFMEKRINIEVVYALPHNQKLLSLSVVEGTTVSEAIRQSRISVYFEERKSIDDYTVGIFSKRILNAEQFILEDGDRIEIYRPLLVDPKEIRRRRAERSKNNK